MTDQDKKDHSQEITDINKFFKVFFTGSSTIPNQGLNLTFFGVEDSSLKLPKFADFLVKYKEYARKKQFFEISNIKEILALGKADKSKFLQFIVLLYSVKNENDSIQRAGIFVGNHKEKGYLIIGIWPFNATKSAGLSLSNFENLLKMILSQKEKFEDVLLIT